MKNADVYLRNPIDFELVNEGVAYVNDDMDEEKIKALRYELQNFVCEGRYAKGMEQILETFLGNVGRSDQPGVWVSGFYGSGKSHFVKMLRALWANQKFADNATARGLANLPREIQDLFIELTNQGKKYGGLHAASGTLSAQEKGSVRLAILGILFKSAGLQEHWLQAQFELWLKKEGIYEDVRGHVEKKGLSWQDKVINPGLSEAILEKLVELRPNIFPNMARCGEALENQFREVKDISSNDMVQAIKRALSRDGKFPLTLVVFDEVQQYIGADSQRAMDIQEAVEACSKSFGGKLVFVGTGQTGLSGTKDLKRIEGRFTQRVELSDEDVDHVIRKVVLAKKESAITPLEKILRDNYGEISRHLANTPLRHTKADDDVFVQDYPILPTRRKLWEKILRAVDLTGTDSQMRNQLTMTHKAIQTNVDLPLGHVVGADYIYFDSAEKLLQSGVLPRNVYSQTMQWHHSENAEQKLVARACGLIFLLNKLKSNKELNITVDVDSLADLLVEDLEAGSSRLRAELPELLDNCDLLMAIDNAEGVREYRIQTDESRALHDEFRNRKSNVANNARRLPEEREKLLKEFFAKAAGKTEVLHGNSKVSRKIDIAHNAQLPGNADKNVRVNVVDGWNGSESSLKSEACQAGSRSPTIYVYLPKSHEDQLRDRIIELIAADETLLSYENSEIPEIKDAWAAIKNIKADAEKALKNALEQIVADAVVFQGGGQSIYGNNLAEMLKEAIDNSLARLYPEFTIADNSDWAKVWEKARKGAPDALKAIGFNGASADNPVCAKILAYIGGGKSYAEVHDYFEGPPFGWSRDAVDGALAVLTLADQIIAADEKGNASSPVNWDRKNLGKTTFRQQTVTISARQRLDIRKLFKQAGLECNSDEEAEVSDRFLGKMLDLAQAAGGGAPKPDAPNTADIELIRQKTGNERLKAIFDARADLADKFEKWSDQGAKIARRMPTWEQLEQLAEFARELSGAEATLKQMDALRAQRRLLADPDPLAPLLTNLVQLLRNELNRLQKAYGEGYEAGMAGLRGDENWSKLEQPQKNELLARNRLDGRRKPQIQVGDAKEILATLRRNDLRTLESDIAALPKRFSDAARAAAEIAAPHTQYVALPRRTLETEAEIDSWLDEAKKLLLEALQKGPVIVK